MNKKEKKLSVKELIQAGGFGAIYLVVYFAFAMLLGFNPITFFITGPIAAVVLGTVYMQRCQKEGQFLFFPFSMDFCYLQTLYMLFLL